jgi:hypothetical protein
MAGPIGDEKQWRLRQCQFSFPIHRVLCFDARRVSRGAQKLRAKVPTKYTRSGAPPAGSWRGCCPSIVLPSSFAGQTALWSKCQLSMDETLGKCPDQLKLLLFRCITEQRRKKKGEGEGKLGKSAAGLQQSTDPS